MVRFTRVRPTFVRPNWLPFERSDTMETASMTQKGKLTQEERDGQLRSLSEGVEKTYRNAEDLHLEAKTLHSHGGLSRALFLYQISLEECGKIDILGACAAQLLAGHGVDFVKLSATLSRHKAKNYSNAYMLPAIGAELEARKAGDWQRSLDAFREMQKRFHDDSNNAKNAALYVDHKNRRFTAPKESITDAMVLAIEALNAAFLAIAQPKVRMLASWATNPDVAEEMTKWYVSRAEELKQNGSGNPDEIFSTLMSEAIERARSGPYGATMIASRTNTEKVS
jgi:AbiV family abortive infection protein